MNTENLKKDNNSKEKTIQEYFLDKNAEEKYYLTMEEIVKERKTRPPIKYLYAGVKERSFGIVFGPSKSGKTVYCENLAMSLAVGRKEFLGDKLDGIPRKVLFISLEEYWENRVDRNLKQMEVFNDEEKELLNQNYRFQVLGFSKYIISEEHWESLLKTIVESDAEVVFIDSLTRMNPGEIEKSKDAEKVMKQLRDLCITNSITLCIVHHSRKGIDKRLTFDSIKGSSVFAQETDFAIGVARTSSNERYIKQVYYRYGKDDFDFVKSFVITDNVWIDVRGEEFEDKLLANEDRRFNDSKLDYLVNFLDGDPERVYKTRELIDEFVEGGNIKLRTFKFHLKEAVNHKLIVSSARGEYQSIKNLSHEEE